MVGLLVAKASIVTAPPSPSSPNLILPGARLPFARPIEILKDSTGVDAVASAGLPMTRSCTGSAPVAFGPVQLTAAAAGAKLIQSAPGAPITHRSSELVAPPLSGAPVTKG